MGAAMIYKIFRSGEWASVQGRTRFEGAPVDLEDGYMHFSTAEQVRETAAKHFAGLKGLILAEIDPALLPEPLKWEPARGGQLFPHLYAPLPMSAIVRTWKLTLSEDGVHEFPELGQSGGDDGVFRQRRTLRWRPERVFSAFARPELLARWWGPEGFSNEFEVFEFKSGGRWKFVMIGPDGKKYPNESFFVSVRPNLLVIRHACPPFFTLSIALTGRGDATELEWIGRFEDIAFAARMRDFLTKANAQNLDRLEAVLEELPDTDAPPRKR